MWWKVVCVSLICYSLIAGMLVPLKPGIIHATPETTKTGENFALKIFGYNTFFNKNSKETRVWLQYDEANAVMANQLSVVDDTTLLANFQMPKVLPKHETSMILSILVDHPTEGHSILPNAVFIAQDSINKALESDAAWQSNPVANIHKKSDFSFPYQNIIYESIRNTYYHVPMWFAMLLMFGLSVFYSILFLMKPELENDRKAVAFSEMGLLFGFLGLFTGMIWANYTWNAPWSNDIKQLMTAVALLIYVAYFILRGSFDEPEKGARLAAVYNIFAFASLIPLLYIVPRLFSSLHPGAQANPTIGSQDFDNTMRMVFYPSIIGWMLLGYWVANIRYRIQRVNDRMLDID
jgi:heme exporter protein C